MNILFNRKFKISGTTADAVYGFGYLCQDVSFRYQAARNAAYLESKRREKEIFEQMRANNTSGNINNKINIKNDNTSVDK